MIAKVINYFRELARRIYSIHDRQQVVMPGLIVTVNPPLLTGISTEEIMEHFRKRMARGFGISLEKLFKSDKKPNQRKRAKAKARQLMRRGRYYHVKRTISI